MCGYLVGCHTCIYVCMPMYACTHVCVNVRLHVCMYVCMHVSENLQIHIHVCIHNTYTHIYMYICVYIYVYIYVYIHIRMPIQKSIPIHEQIRMEVCVKAYIRITAQFFLTIHTCRYCVGNIYTYVQMCESCVRVCKCTRICTSSWGNPRRSPRALDEPESKG